MFTSKGYALLAAACIEPRTHDGRAAPLHRLACCVNPGCGGVCGGVYFAGDTGLDAASARLCIAVRVAPCDNLHASLHGSVLYPYELAALQRPGSSVPDVDDDAGGSDDALQCARRFESTRPTFFLVACEAADGSGAMTPLVGVPCSGRFVYDSWRVYVDCSSYAARKALLRAALVRVVASFRENPDRDEALHSLGMDCVASPAVHIVIGRPTWMALQDCARTYAAIRAFKDVVAYCVPPDMVVVRFKGAAACGAAYKAIIAAAPECQPRFAASLDGYMAIVGGTVGLVNAPYLGALHVWSCAPPALLPPKATLTCVQHAIVDSSVDALLAPEDCDFLLRA